NAIRPEDGVASGFVEDLVTLVHHLDVLRKTDGTVRVWRSAVATDAREGNAVEIQDRRRNARGKETKDRPVIHNRVRAIDMRVRYLWIFGSLSLLTVIGNIPGGHLAQRRRDIVVIGRDDLDAVRAEGQGGRAREQREPAEGKETCARV